MTTLTIPRHTRNLYQFTPDARAALMHESYASRAREYNRIASDVDTEANQRKFYRYMARHNAAEARHYFARWLERR